MLIFIINLAQEKSSLLREEIAQLRVTAESTASKLERTTLQLDGAQSANAELERLNDELKRSDGEIKRQLDKWQSLENKGGAEVEAMRKRRIELEVQVKELENRLGGANKREKENTSALEKERVRVSKLKEILGEWRVSWFKSCSLSSSSQPIPERTFVCMVASDRGGTGGCREIQG